MAPHRKRNKFKEWLSDFFSPKFEVHYTPDGPLRSVRPGSFFGYAQDFAIHNPAMTSVQGDHNIVTFVNGDRNIVPHIMSLLTQYIIRGASHDSSARTPPPRCHPDTRIKLIARIAAWFHGKEQQELVLWITGPAGVGKSAVVQTFAEYLGKLNFLGASVFISRPNKRNNPHGVFITIAYQLATRIEAYRNFIVERLSLDPELLNGDMRRQFTAFIVEPFVVKKIGAGCDRWGILLDGLDELEGEDAQREIIYLISTFAQEHPNTPLAWVIASRPESHITNAFDEDDVRQGYWSERIPIDSTEACEDVERFLRSSFKMIRRKSPNSVPPDWPSDTQFLKLTAAASGLFVYAEVVMQFIRDPDHSDPVSRLKVLVSVVDRCNGTPNKDNPFVHLDALYHQIISSIPSNIWPVAKRLLRFVSGQGPISRPCRGTTIATLRGISILFGLTPHVIYTCVIKCYSVLRVPDWKVAHKEALGFLHASFSDYLKDPSRSGEFYVGNDEDADVDVGLSLLSIWIKCSGDETSTVETAWQRYCLKWDDKSPSRAIKNFHADLFHDVVLWLARMIPVILEKPAESPIYAQLHKVHMIKLSHYFNADGLWWFVGSLAETMVKDRGILRRIHLKDLKFGHLDWEMMSPTRGPHGRGGILSNEQWTLYRLRTKVGLEGFLSELEFLQRRSPELEVVIVGGEPQGRVAAFRTPLKDRPEFGHDYMSYIIPYPE